MYACICMYVCVDINFALLFRYQRKKKKEKENKKKRKTIFSYEEELVGDQCNVYGIIIFTIPREATRPSSVLVTSFSVNPTEYHRHKLFLSSPVDGKASDCQ